MEATIKTLATKDDITSVRDEIAKSKFELRKDIGDSIKWMFIFWVGQIGATLAIIFLFFKK